MAARTVEDLPAEFDPQPKKRFRPGFFTYLAIVLTALVVLLGGFYAVWYHTAESARAAQQARIVARGDPYWLADLSQNGILLAEDGTSLFKEAVDSFQPPSAQFHQRSTLGRIPRTQPGDYPEFRQALADNRQSLAFLSQAIERGRARFLTPDDRLTHSFYYDLPQFAVLLDAAVLQALGEGDSDVAADAVLQLLGLAELLRGTESLDPQSQRLWFGIVAIVALQDVLAHTNLSASQISDLDAQLAEIAESYRLQPAVIDARCSMATTLAQFDWRDWPRFKPPIQQAYEWLPPHVMQEQTTMIAILDRTAEVIDQPGLQGQQSIDQIKEEVAHLPLRFLLARGVLSSVVPMRDGAMRYRQRLINARFALRVDAYYNQNGSFPETLADVLDDDLPEVPLGLFSEKPLVYRHDENGFVIYDIGGNLVDDGGDAKVDSQEGNIFEVQYPAAARGNGDEESLQ